jgi:hypothetical protein
MSLFLVSVEGKFSYKLEGSFSVEADSQAEAETIGQAAIDNGTASIDWKNGRIPDDEVDQPVITEIETLADGDEDIRERF